MAKALDVLKRMVRLVEGKKIPEREIHRILNGTVINGGGVYRNGSLYQDDKVQNLSADKINVMEWPKAVAKAALKPKPEPKLFD